MYAEAICVAGHNTCLVTCSARGVSLTFSGIKFVFLFENLFFTNTASVLNTREVSLLKRKPSPTIQHHDQ
jgi:hypothetical protein